MLKIISSPWDEMEVDRYRTENIVNNSLKALERDGAGDFPFFSFHLWNFMLGLRRLRLSCTFCRRVANFNFPLSLFLLTTAHAAAHSHSRERQPSRQHYFLSARLVKSLMVRYYIHRYSSACASRLERGNFFFLYARPAKMSRCLLSRVTHTRARTHVRICPYSKRKTLLPLFSWTLILCRRRRRRFSLPPARIKVLSYRKVSSVCVSYKRNCYKCARRGRCYRLYTAENEKDISSASSIAVFYFAML